MKFLSPSGFVLTLSFTCFSLSSSFDVTAAMPKVIYGEDDRVFASQSENELYQRLAASTAVQIKNDKLTLSEDGLTFKINPEQLKDSFMDVCEDEQFADVINAGNCSGFLVGADLLVTAGHCMRSQSDCESGQWAFNYKMVNLGVDSEVKADQVYGCKEIVNQALSNGSKNDFALIRLEKEVVGREPLQFRTEGKIDDVSPLVVIGHPSGLPTVIADNAYVRENDNDFYFRANLDTFGGNSGSAVFNAETGIVEGILVRGERDYRFDASSGCNRVYQCENDSCRGEDVTRITVIPELAPGMTPVEPEVSDEGPRFPFFLGN
jgi:V8-like Glu-specific endopeptidase